MFLGLIITGCVCICVKNKGSAGGVVAPTTGPTVIGKWFSSVLYQRGTSFQPRHDKTKQNECAPSEDSDQSSLCAQ